MHQKQLTEHYYQILNEISFGGIWNGAKRGAGGLGRGVRGLGRGIMGGIGGIGTAIDALSPLLPYAAAGAGAYYGTDLLKGLLGAVQPVSGRGNNSNNGSARVVDADVARGLASGDKEDYYDYLADLQNSDMTGNQRTGSITRTRALAFNMAKNKAAQMKAFALSDKSPKGAAYLKAKADYEAARKSDPDIDDPSKTLSGTRPDGTSFSVGGKRMSDKAKAAYDAMQKARKEALGAEYTVGDMEGKRPSNKNEEEARKKEAEARQKEAEEHRRGERDAWNSGSKAPKTEDPNDLDSPEEYEDFDEQEKANEIADDSARARALEAIEKKKREREGNAPNDPYGENFKNYYNFLREATDEQGGTVDNTKKRKTEEAETAVSQTPEQKAKDAEEAKKSAEAAKKAAEEAENARLATNAGSYSSQMAIANSLESGPLNLQPVERTRGGFSVGRGFGGKPIITGGSYVNPNSAEARVRADVASGKLPASFGQYQGNRLPMDLEAERQPAGDEAASKSVGFDVTGLSQQEIRDKIRDRVRKDTSAEEHHLRMQDLEKNGPMPTDEPGSLLDPTSPAYLNYAVKFTGERAKAAKKESERAYSNYAEFLGPLPSAFPGGIPELLVPNPKFNVSKEKQDKATEIKAGEDLLKSMQMHKGEVEADNIRRNSFGARRAVPAIIGTPELLAPNPALADQPESPKFDVSTEKPDEDVVKADLQRTKDFIDRVRSNINKPKVSTQEDRPAIIGTPELLAPNPALADQPESPKFDMSQEQPDADVVKADLQRRTKDFINRVKSNIKKPKVSTQKDRDAMREKSTDEWLDKMRAASKI